MFIMIYYKNKKLYPIQLEWAKIVLLAIFIFGSFIFSKFMGDHFFINIIITVIYPYILVKIGIIRSTLIQEILGSLK
mgnify:FL=1